MAYGVFDSQAAIKHLFNMLTFLCRNISVRWFKENDTRKIITSKKPDFNIN